MLQLVAAPFTCVTHETLLRERIFIKAAILLWLLQPRPEVLAHVQRIRATLHLRHPYIAMHVRHGDKWKVQALPLPPSPFQQRQQQHPR